MFNLLKQSDNYRYNKKQFWQSQSYFYDWRFTVNQFVLAPSPLRPTISIFSSNEHLHL
jgi:hypothetical protein